jgi:hypothetical protein
LRLGSKPCRVACTSWSSLSILGCWPLRAAARGLYQFQGRREHETVCIKNRYVENIDARAMHALARAIQKFPTMRPPLLPRGAFAALSRLWMLFALARAQNGQHLLVFKRLLLPDDLRVRQLLQQRCWRHLHVFERVLLPDDLRIRLLQGAMQDHWLQRLCVCKRLLQQSGEVLLGEPDLGRRPGGAGCCPAPAHARRAGAACRLPARCPRRCRRGGGDVGQASAQDVWRLGRTRRCRWPTSAAGSRTSEWRAGSAAACMHAAALLLARHTGGQRIAGACLPAASSPPRSPCPPLPHPSAPLPPARDVRVPWAGRRWLDAHVCTTTSGITAGASPRCSFC